MTDSILLNKKKKVTLKASERGIVKAESTLIRLGFESKSNFAASQLISRSTVTKFFQGEKIQLDSFKRICTALELSWQEIAGMLEAEELKRSSEFDRNAKEETEEVGKMRTLCRKVTVVNLSSKKIRSVITLEGDIDSVDNWEIIQLLVRQNSGCSVNIVNIESGSIRLTLEGSQEDIQRLVDKIRSSELTELNNFFIEDVEIITESLDVEQNDALSVKWQIFQEIIMSATLSDFGLNLSNIDMSDADLNSANLSGANLSGTDLSNADLSNANLSNANLSNANLSGTDLSNANLSNANLIDANLIDANLSNADLSNADLKRSNLIGANLRIANLSGTKLVD
jgi:uncharacterized protein YjbI with pentapeptide repeats/DNA-binding Xre family transcriptional regulator